MMWLQYVADVGNTVVEQIEAASVRTSLRRMSRAILVLENENGQSATSVLPEEEEEGSDASGSPEANDNDTGDELPSEDKGGSSFANAVLGLGNTLVLSVICFGYPVAVLPYYRAQSTTE